MGRGLASKTSMLMVISLGLLVHGQYHRRRQYIHLSASSRNAGGYLGPQP